MTETSARIQMLALVCVGALAGCATAIPGLDKDTGRVGSNPGGLSPQVVYEPPEFKQLVWWNAASFQPVPEDTPAGLAFCSCLGNADVKYVPIGYHPYARDSGGYPIAGGGYLCVAKTGQ